MMRRIQLHRGLGKSPLGRGSSLCKGPEVDTSLACFRKEQQSWSWGNRVRGLAEGIRAGGAGVRFILEESILATCGEWRLGVSVEAATPGRRSLQNPAVTQW